MRSVGAMFNARNFATWTIAMVVVTLLYQLATEQTDMVTTPAGLVFLVLALVFRDRIFRVVRGQVDGALDKSVKALTGVGEPVEGEEFDPDAAFARYMETRVVEDVAAADAAPRAPAFAPPPPRRGFGRKGA